MIEEQNAVEMVDLVLNRARLVSVRVDARAASFLIERLDDDTERTGDIAEDVGNRQASLLGNLVFFTAFDDDRIDEYEGGRILLTDIHDGHATRDADLIRGEPDTFRRAHGLEQVVDEPAHGVIHLRDGSR